MRLCLILFSTLAFAAPRVDNVLLKMTPPDATSLVGARMDALKSTDLYRKLIEAQSLPQIDQFAKDTGFDPRRDVRELLFVTTPKGKVLLARGTFHLNAFKDLHKTRHGRYTIFGNEGGGFCVLDPSLAAAGDPDAIAEALDEWTSGSHHGADKLLAQLNGVSEKAQLWGGSRTFLLDLPVMSGGVDFSKIFRGMENVWFQADLNTGLLAEIHSTTANDKDAMALRDGVRGLVGFGRLSVPPKNPDLLRLWDGITAEQSGRAVTVKADISQELIEKLVQLLSTGKRPSVVI